GHGGAGDGRDARAGGAHRGDLGGSGEPRRARQAARKARQEVIPLQVDGPDRAERTIVLAHGAGAPMDSPFLNHFARGLAARGLRVVRFEFPYMRARRSGRRSPPDRPPVLNDCWREVVTALGGAQQLVIGGKSLGCRIASLVADELSARGLVCL